MEPFTTNDAPPPNIRPLNTPAGAGSTSSIPIPNFRSLNDLSTSGSLKKLRYAQGPARLPRSVGRSLFLPCTHHTSRTAVVLLREYSGALGDLDDAIAADVREPLHQSRSGPADRQLIHGLRLI